MQVIIKTLMYTHTWPGRVMSGYYDEKKFGEMRRVSCVASGRLRKEVI